MCSALHNSWSVDSGSRHKAFLVVGPKLWNSPRIARCTIWFVLSVLWWRSGLNFRLIVFKFHSHHSVTLASLVYRILTFLLQWIMIFDCDFAESDHHWCSWTLRYWRFKSLQSRLELVFYNILCVIFSVHEYVKSLEGCDELVDRLSTIDLDLVRNHSVKLCIYGAWSVYSFYNWICWGNLQTQVCLMRLTVLHGNH